MAKAIKNPLKGLHIHRVKPILFGGSATDTKNIIFITRLEHAEMATFWNRKVREVKNDSK